MADFVECRLLEPEKMERPGIFPGLSKNLLQIKIRLLLQ
jgi:hypothetical protein